MPTPPPGLTTEDPPNAHKAALEESMSLQGLDHVVTAAGIKATAVPHKRAQNNLIQPDEFFGQPHHESLLKQVYKITVPVCHLNQTFVFD
jgi:hypothetical protein